MDNRLDFRNVDAGFELLETGVQIHAPEDFQIAQLEDILRDKLAGRGVDGRCLDPGEIEGAEDVLEVLALDLTVDGAAGGKRFLRDAVGAPEHFPVELSAGLDDLLTDVRTTRYDLLGLSSGCRVMLSAAAETIARLREASPTSKILIGGYLTQLEPDLRARVNADYISGDPAVDAVLLHQALQPEG